MIGLLQSAARMAGDHARQVARNAAKRAAFLVVGLVFVSLALAFGGVALFLWFATMMPPALAGLAVAGVALVLALIALLVAGRSSSPPPPRLELSGLSAEDEKRIAEAEALGKLIGRDLGGVPLVLTALVIGIIVGRSKGR